MKIIGIPAWKSNDGNSIGVSLPYITYIGGFGVPRIIMPEEEVVDNLDLLIIPGGPDVDSLRYGMLPGYHNSKPDPIKEYFDLVMLPKYIKAGIPIFGICRGIQTICVHFGAKLIQHMYHETSEERWDVVHGIEIQDETLKHLFANRKFGVNSLHHQCVSSIGFPKELSIVGVYTQKGKNSSHSSIEVIKHKTLPIWGVQYHPEELVYDPLGNYIVTQLLEYKELHKEVELAKVAYD
jgi:putative glutamine amidotransferase